MKRSALTQLPNALRLAPGGDAAGGPALPGYSALPQTFTLNSVTPPPTFIFWGRDATTSTWPERNGLITLGTFNSGADPTVGVASPFPNPSDTVVTWGAATLDKHYQAGVSTFGDILDQDFVAEIIFMTPAGASWPGIVSKKTSAGSGVSGWRFTGVPSSFRLNMFLRDSVAGNVNVQNTGTLFTNGVWYHIMVFGDRSGDARMYQNGVLIRTLSIATLDGLSLAGTDAFAIGAVSSQVSAPPGPGFLAYAALWQDANLCSGATADQDALAAARFALTGL